MEWGLGGGESKIPFVIDETNINKGKGEVGGKKLFGFDRRQWWTDEQKTQLFPCFSVLCSVSALGKQSKGTSKLLLASCIL